MIRKISTSSFIFFALLAGMLSSAQIEISEDEIKAQEKAFTSTVSFGEAFRRAVFSYFSNGDDSESLVALVASIYPDTLREAELSRILNDRDTILNILTLSEQVAPHGENISENWIFTLKTSMSDHIFYAVISRNDQLMSNTYGFN